MMKKDRLLAGLNELVYVEEGMIGMYASFAKAMVQQTEGMEIEKKKKIEKLLSTLHRDSSRHKEIIDKMVLEVGASNRDEY